MYHARPAMIRHAIRIVSPTQSAGPPMGPTVRLATPAATNTPKLDDARRKMDARRS